MIIKLCDRCRTMIEPQTRAMLRTREERTRALLRPKGDNEFIIDYDLCPRCKDLFLDFMEGEAIPPCRTSPKEK